MSCPFFGLFSSDNTTMIRLAWSENGVGYSKWNLSLIFGPVKDHDLRPNLRQSDKFKPFEYFQCQVVPTNFGYWRLIA